VKLSQENAVNLQSTPEPTQPASRYYFQSKEEAALAILCCFTPAEIRRMAEEQRKRRGEVKE
jgi:hypothetical protein